MIARIVRSLVRAVLVGLCGAVAVFASSSVNPLQELVRKSFSAEYAGFLMTTSKGNHVEVCGDTCTYFDWTGDSNDEAIWRFIVLYEVNDSPGTDVAAFLQNVRMAKEGDLLEKSFCSVMGGDISTVICNWGAYADSLKIKVGHSRYDEGNRCFAEIIDWKTKTSSKWKCAPMKPGQSPFK